jgi:Xaa-Pro aminopeptidase
MNDRLSERLNGPISTQELERRWGAIRAEMAAAGIDVLVAQNNNDHMGGYLRYITDVPAVNGYPLTVIVPADAEMTLVRHGTLDGELAIGDDHPILRGVERVLSTASFSSVSYTHLYDAKLALRALQPYARGRIGLLGTYQMGHAFAKFLVEELPHADFIEASDLVDRVRMIKSDEEIALIRRTAELQDIAMAAAFDRIEPGLRDSDIAATAQHVAQEHGAEQGIFLCASMPPGAAEPFGPRHLQDRVIRSGDTFALLVETNGPGGLYTELGRSCVLGEPAESLLEDFAFALEAQRMCVDMLKPGASSALVFAEYNEFMREHGRPVENRVHCHSQGCDMVERPLIRSDETWAIDARMNITCHPGYLRNGLFTWVCDNFLVKADGTAERLHAFPQIIVQR